MYLFERMWIYSLTVIKFVFRTGSFLVKFLFDPVLTLFSVVPPDLVLRKKEHTFLPIGEADFLGSTPMFLLVLVPTTFIALNVGGLGGCPSRGLWVSFFLEERSPNVSDSILVAGLGDLAHFFIHNQGDLAFLLGPNG